MNVMATKGASLILPLLGVIALSPAALADTGANWWDEHVSFGGDARLRYQATRVSPPGEDDRRERYRTRFGFLVDASDNVEFELRLATGTGNPTSRNLDFGESFALDDNIRVDRAWLAWTLEDRLQLVAGKMKNPMFRAGGDALIWDNDVTPEGFAARYDGSRLFTRVGAFILSDRISGPESQLYAVQAGSVTKLSETASFTAGLSWYDYTDIAGHSVLFAANPRGNSVDAAGNYLYDYDIIEAFGEYRRTIAGRPVTLFARWAQNTRADAANTAYSAGVAVGKTDEPGDFEFGWAWRDTEADALVGIYTDSNLAGGSTDSKGQLLTGTYRLTKHIDLGATFIFSELGGFTGTTRDFDRMMLEIEFSF
ncbi:MAG: putative porin [Woeseia sp.]